MSDGGRRNGFLFIADISGYTAFLTGTELEHAQGIIEDLVAVIHSALVPALELVKLEGDALFCYADAARFTDGERLLELIESCYYEFRARLEQMKRATTCTCAACASSDTLDLKFAAHYGEFLVREMAGVQDLAGPDVILVHRLLKNAVSADTGLRGYALVTDACAAFMPVTGTWPRRVEHVESMADVNCVLYDLAPSVAVRKAAHRIFVEPADADFAFKARLPAPPVAVWQYWVEADKAVRWENDLKSVTFERNAEGRMADGAVGHCDHGGWASDMRFVDWRPFSYFTLERTIPRSSFVAAPPATETLELVPLEDGATELHYRIRATRSSGRLKLRLFGPMVQRNFRRQVNRLEKALQEDQSSEGRPPDR